MLRVLVLRVNKTVWSLDCRMTATPRSTPRPFGGSSTPGALGCWSRAAKGQKGGRWREGATGVNIAEETRNWRSPRQVTWIRAGSRGRRSPQEAVVTAEMPAANWIPVELPRKGLPLGGPAFTRQSICLKPGRVFDIWWVFLRRSLYRARAEAPTCTPASAEQGAQHKIKGHALLGF